MNITAGFRTASGGEHEKRHPWEPGAVRGNRTPAIAIVRGGPTHRKADFMT